MKSRVVRMKVENIIFSNDSELSREQVLPGNQLICFLVLILGMSFNLLEKGERGLVTLGFPVLMCAVTSQSYTEKGDDPVNSEGKCCCWK